VGSFPIQVTGTVNSPTAVITVNGVPVSNQSGVFAASVALKQGHNTVVARAVEGAVQASDSIALSLDMTPPYVTIESHVDGQTVHASPVTITGLINDIVRGTVEQSQATVSVNGVTATIANRSYAAEGVSLTPGDNLITVTGTDQVGNVGNARIALRYVPLTGRRHLEIASGQDQAAPIGAGLANPLVVRVLNDAQAPAANLPVVFRVMQGDGLVGVGTSREARAIVAETDDQGLARTRFKLGMRSGSANHKVRAQVVGYDDEVVFYASATGKSGNKISVNSGNNQRGAVGSVLPEALVVTVPSLRAAPCTRREPIATGAPPLNTSSAPSVVSTPSASRRRCSIRRAVSSSTRASPRPRSFRGIPG
jgi:hypothetical protein